MTQITVTRALSELGTISDRIATAIRNGVFVGVVKGTNQKPIGNTTFKDYSELSTAISASFSSVEDLIERQFKLNAAIVQSNSTAKVVIAGKELTVAQAISAKKYAEDKKLFLIVLRTQLLAAHKTAAAQNQQVDEKIERLLIATYSSQDKNQLSQAQVDAVSSPVKRDETATIVTTKNDLNVYIANFEKELNDFLTECDFVLSESNCSTLIEV